MLKFYKEMAIMAQLQFITTFQIFSVCPFFPSHYFMCVHDLINWVLLTWEIVLPPGERLHLCLFQWQS